MKSRVHQKITTDEETRRLVEANAESIKAEMVARARQGRTYTPEEVQRLKEANAERIRQAHEEIMAGALTAAEVAVLLGGKSRDIGYKRLKRGTLLAVEEAGTLWFPVWQFDTSQRNGVIQGLPKVLKTLGQYGSPLSPMQKARFLTNPNPYLGNKTPLEALKAGEVESVVGIARAVGVC